MKLDFRRRGLRIELLESRVMLAADCQQLDSDILTYAGTIDRQYEARDYCLTLTTAGRLTIEMQADGNSTLDSYVKLFATAAPSSVSADKLILLNDNESAGANAAGLSLHVTPGTYRIQATAAPGSLSTGNFRLTAQLQPAEPPYDPIEILEGGAGSTKPGQFNDDNGDGLVNDTDFLDLVVVSNDANLIEIFLGLGDGSFARQSPEEPYRVVDQAGSVALGDFNGDKATDFAVGGLASKTVTLFFGKGNGTFEKGDMPLPVMSEPGQAAAADMNLDGCDDLAVPTEQHGLQIFFSSPSESGTGCTLSADPRRTVAPSVTSATSQPDDRPSAALKTTLEVSDSRGVAIRKFGDDFLIAATSRGGSKVLTWQTQANASGPPRFVGPQIVSACAEGTFTIVLDHFNTDSDHHWDFATVNDKSGTVSVALAKDDGSFDNPSDCESQSAPHIYGVGKDSEVIVAADFNNDGIVDLATQNEDTYDVSVLLGKGGGKFHSHITTLVHTKPDDLAVGDFDRDGNLDLAVATRNRGVIVLFGLGDGSFVQERPISVGEDPQTLVQGDFNHDGAIDVAVANAASNDVSVLLGRGDGSFQPQRIFSLDEETSEDSQCPSQGGKEGLYPRSLVVADLNRDGRLDLATSNARSDNVSILRGMGTGEFQFWQHIKTGESPWSMVADDFDDDGFVDLATANRRSNDATVLFGSANGCFAKEDIAVGSFPERIVVASGSTQLGTVNRLSNDLSWWSVVPSSLAKIGEPRLVHPQTDSQFPLDFLALTPDDVPGWQYGSRAANDFGDGDGERAERFDPRFMVADDLNNDKHLDIVVADDDVHELSIFLGYGDGTFQPALRIPTSSDPEFIAVKDIDGDGKLDLVSANDSEDLVGVFYGKGDGTFEKERTYAKNGIKSPEDVVIADLTGDGIADLAVANDSVGTLAILTGSLENGRVAFNSAVVEGIGANAGMAVGDFTGNGAIDLAVMDRSKSVIRILTQRGGVLKEVRTIPLSDPSTNFIGVAAPKYLAARDLDNDGALDIVAADLVQNRIWIVWTPKLRSRRHHVTSTMLGDAEDFGSAAVFSARTESKNYSGAGDSSIRQVALEDFNGDGNVDIAVVQESNDSVWILLGNGERSFLDDVVNPGKSNRIRVEVGQEPGTLVAGHFNADGIVDLVVGNRESDDLSVLLGTGKVDESCDCGLFTLSTTIFGRPEPPPSLTIHVNGDSRLDRVAIDEPNNALRVELDIGAGEFVAVSTEAPSGVEPALADFNGDGITDVVTVSARGDVLLRLGRGGEELGTFDPPQFVDDKSHARDAVAVATAGGTWLLATADTAGDTVSFYAFDVAGKPTLRGKRVPVGFGPWRLATANLNEDNLGDLVVVNWLEHTASVLIQQNVATSKGKISPDAHLFRELNPAQRIDIGTAGADVLLADISGSNLVDLVMADPASGIVRIWPGKGNGAFDAALSIQAGEDLYGLSDGALRGRLKPSNIAVGEFGGDGKRDIATANSGEQSLTLLLGRTGGVPSPSNQRSRTAAPPGQIVVGRFNDDALDDLAILYPGLNQVGVRWRMPGGGWSDEETYGVGNRPAALSVGDVNRDEIIDMLVSNEFGDLLVLLGKEDGRFATYRRADSGVRIAVADLNGDGKDDVVFANPASDEVCVNDDEHCYGTGGKTLAPSVPSVSDLNRDGHLDLIIPNRGSNDVLVFLGKSDGTLTEPALSFQVGAQPTFVSVADVTGDDIPDLIVANEGSNDVTILRGVGREDTWELATGLRIDTGGGPVHIQVQDVFGDHREVDDLKDLIVTNSRSNTVVILPGRGEGYFTNAGTENTLVTGKHPVESLIIGRSLLTINRDSNTFTQFELDTGRQIDVPTGGNRPLRGVVEDFNLDSRPDLGIAHEDGSFSVFVSGPRGFQLTSVFQSQSRIDLSDIALVQRDDGFELFGVGNGRSQLVPLTQFRRVSLVTEFFTAIGDLAAAFLPFAATRILPGGSAFVVRQAIQAFVQIGIDVFIDGILVPFEVDGGAFVYKDQFSDEDLTYPLPDDEEVRRLLAGIGQQMVVDCLTAPEAEAVGDSPGIEGSTVDETSNQGATNRRDATDGQAGHEIPAAPTMNEPEGSLPEEPGQDFIERPLPGPSLKPARAVSLEGLGDEPKRSRFDENRVSASDLNSDRQAKLSRWLIGLLAGLSVVGLTAAGARRIRRHVRGIAKPGG